MAEEKTAPSDSELAAAIAAVLAGLPLPVEMGKEEAIAALLMQLDDVGPEAAKTAARFVVLGASGQS